MPAALTRLGRARDAALTLTEETFMNRSIPLTLALVAALAAQVGCSKKEDVATPSADATASAPDAGASSSMMAASAPMDSSAAAGADAASAAASDAAAAASH
jgi:hypothetical protein